MNIRLIVLSTMMCLGGGLWAGDGRSAFSPCDVSTDPANASKCDIRTRCFYITQKVLRKGKRHTHAWLFVYDNKTLTWVCSDVRYVAEGKSCDRQEQSVVEIKCGNYLFLLRRMKDGQACVALGDTRLLVLEAQRRCAWNSKRECVAIMNIVSIPMFAVHDVVAYRYQLHVASWLACFGERTSRSMVPLCGEYEEYVGNTIERFWGEVLEAKFTSKEVRKNKFFRPFEWHSSEAPRIVSQEVLF
jgi:hypothetical protein